MKRTGLIAMHLVMYCGAMIAIGSPVTAATVMFGAVLIWISVVDAERFEIPDLAVLILILGGGVVALWDRSDVDWLDLLLGATAWPALFWTAAEVFRRRRGYDGLGFGDVKLVAGLGVWLGFAAMVQVVLASAIAGIVFLLGARIATRTETHSAVAFGPFLCLSAWMIWLAKGAT